jgi:hypothetical protein
LIAAIKTRKTGGDVQTFLKSVSDRKRKDDTLQVLALMKKLTGCEPAMWGPSIVGFGDFRYRYANGTENDWFLTGFSPRKQSLTLYIMTGFAKYEEILENLGKYKTGKSCLYIKKVEDVDLAVLEQLISASIAHLQGSKS